MAAMKAADLALVEYGERLLPRCSGCLGLKA